MADGVSIDEDIDGVTVRWSVEPVQGATSLQRRLPARPRVLTAGAAFIVGGLLALTSPLSVYGAPAGVTVASETLVVPLTPLMLGLVVVGLAALLVGCVMVVLGSPRKVVAAPPAQRVRGQLRIDARGVHIRGRLIPWDSVETLQRTPGSGRVTLSHDGENHVLIDRVDGATAWAVASQILARQPQLKELDADALSAMRKLRGRSDIGGSRG